MKALRYIRSCAQRKAVVYESNGAAMIQFKLRSHPTRRKAEVVEIYDDDELLGTLIPGADNGTLARSVALFSTFTPRGYELVVFAKEPIAPAMDSPNK